MSDSILTPQGKTVKKNPLMMKIPLNEDGKFILKNEDGKDVYFTHAVDVKEALEAKDPATGKNMYFVPGSTPAKRSTKVIKSEDPIENDEIGQIEEEEEDVNEEIEPVVKTINKTTKKRGRKPLSQKEEDESGEDEDEGE